MERLLSLGNAVAPQRLSYFLLNSIPVSLIVFAFALFGFLMDGGKKDARFSVRQMCMLVLLAYAGYTTLTADEPQAALEKWDWVWKAMVFAIFLPLTLRTRLRIEALALTMTLSLAALVASLLHHLVEFLQLRARRAHQRAELLAVVGAQRRGRTRRRDE